MRDLIWSVHAIILLSASHMRPSLVQPMMRDVLPMPAPPATPSSSFAVSARIVSVLSVSFLVFMASLVPAIATEHARRGFDRQARTEIPRRPPDRHRPGQATVRAVELDGRERTDRLRAERELLRFDRGHWCCSSLLKSPLTSWSNP